MKVTRLGSFSGRRKQRQFWRGPSETGGRQCPPRGVSPDGGQTVSASSAWSDAAADKWREGRVHKHSKGWGLPAVGRTAGPFLLCNLCVWAVCKGQRRRQFAQGGCVRLCLRPESLYPGIGRSKRRRQVPVVLGFRPSPHHLKTGVAEVGFWQRRGLFFLQEPNQRQQHFDFKTSTPFMKTCQAQSVYCLVSPRLNNPYKYMCFICFPYWGQVGIPEFL